jgi:hypothetical protein
MSFLIGFLFLFSGSTYSCHNKADTQSNSVDQLTNQMDMLALENEYQSDSEDEAGYSYGGLPALSDELPNGPVVLLGRGIHFSTSFSKKNISESRRKNEKGVPIYARAAYECSEQAQEVEKIRRLISDLPKEKRCELQEEYVKSYSSFLRKFLHNPLISTSEDLEHAARYAAGLKFNGLLKPEYDKYGKPKHPYLGKLFVILMPQERVADLDPFFVVASHANGDITIPSYPSKNLLAEREVTFPGLIPGDCVVCSVNVRVPSFKGEYKDYYNKKYGLTSQIYSRRKKRFTKPGRFQFESNECAKTLLKDVIIPHVANQLLTHVNELCHSSATSIVYKDLSPSGFSESLPTLQEAKDKHNEACA